MQEQYHSQGFKEMKQIERIENRNQRQKREEQKRIEEQKRLKRQEEQRIAEQNRLKRLEAAQRIAEQNRLKRLEAQRIAEQQRMKSQRQIAQSKIVDTVLKLPKLPPKIEYDSLVSMTYFQNYKGFNRNAPGKNILNIGEQHYGIDYGFSQFEDFLDMLVAKNKYLGECLDFVYESGLKNVNKSPLFQKQGSDKITRKFRNQSSTLVSLRNYFDGKTIIKGFRAHHTDPRLGFDGFFSTLINISRNYDLDYEYLVRYIYDFTDGSSFDITELEMQIFNELLTLDTDNLESQKKTKQTIQKLKKIYSENPSNFEMIVGVNYDESMKYYERDLKNIEIDNMDYKKFINSINDFVRKTVGYWRLKENGNILVKEDMTKVNREMYYKYLEQKRWERNYVEDDIFRNKRFDLKFRKQIENLDTRYFQSDPKKTILLYYLNTKYIYPQDSANFYDINTLCRVFRKFDQSKYRYTSCDQADKSMSNVIIYSGNHHTEKFNQFLLDLPAIKVEYGNISMDGKKIETPVLFFGDIGDTTQNKIYKVEKKNPTRVEIPTNFDYFNYNKKIVQKLKDVYNVKQYTQLPKAIQQKEITKKKRRRMETLVVYSQLSKFSNLTN